MCLCFLLRRLPEGRAQVLPGLKKQGLGQGRLVGLGGHVEPGESPRAAMREVLEESGVPVNPADLTEMGQSIFRFPARPSWNQSVTVFTAKHWQGEPSESDEIAPQWFEINRLPFERMWDDARSWLPHLLGGRRLSAEIVCADNNQTVNRAELHLPE